jgi:hypothetical protein
VVGLGSEGASDAAISREVGIARATVARILNRPRKRAQVVRSGDEFSLAEMSAHLEPPRDTALSSTMWTVPQIRAARDAQLRGEFEQPAKMAAMMRTDDALFVARDNRLAPQRCVGVTIQPAGDGPQETAKRYAAEAEALYGTDGVAIAPGSIADVNGDLADHGIAIGYLTPQVREDGSRVDLYFDHWPMEAVRFESWTGRLMTRVETMPTEGSRFQSRMLLDVPINHGDGRWVVFANHSTKPWRQSAALLPASLVWARHAHGVIDWVKASGAHGNAKVVGEMPADMLIRGKEGDLTKEAQDFMALLRAVASKDAPVGLKPAGAGLDYLVNSSNAWQVWKELIMNAEKAAARIYLGTDGVLGSQGGAPGVDISQLFGVATTKVQGDLTTIERGFHSGVLVPWCAINFGDSRLAPRRVYDMPDADSAAARKEYAEASAAFWADIERHRTLGFELTQDYVNELAKRYGVRAPTLGEMPAPPAPPGASEPSKDDPDEDEEDEDEET